MRLRKKNVSRVAAVAVAAVMAVSAAAPVAVAAAPAVNGGTAVVQEASEHVIGINYKNSDTGEFIQTGSVKVSNSATQITADMLEDVPANWVVDSVFVPVNINSATEFVDIYCKPAPATKTIKVAFVDVDTNKRVGDYGECEITVGQEQADSSTVTGMPAGYEAADATFAVGYEADSYTLPVKKTAPAKKTIKVNFVDVSTNKSVGDGECEITVGQLYAKTADVKGMPAGYEAADPEFAVGYEADTYNVPVKKTAPAKKTIKVAFVDFSTNERVGDYGECTITEGQLYAKTADVKGMPAGYEAADKEFAVGYDAEVYTVAVNKVARKVTVEYRDADNWNTVVGTEVIEVAGDAAYVGTDVLTKVPAGWTVTADTTQVAVGVDTTSVAVTKAARKVTVEYRDADNWETVVGTEEIEVAGDADYVGTDVLTKVPAGWTVRSEERR